MNDETTRLISEEEAKKQVPANVQNKVAPKKQAKKNRGGVAAATVGGFVAGAAAGGGATMAAQEAPVNRDELVAALEDENPATEPVATPEPEEVILATDEGVRYAHVEADNFSEAFAQAREQVGPGGVFEYNGNLYGTYTAEEWNAMSAGERADYQNRVSHSAMAQADAVADADSNPDVVDEVVAEGDMIAAEPVENEIRVLGVEAVQNDEGQIMNVALVEANGDQVLMVDVDNDGTMDVLLHDDNGDGVIQESEVYTIEEAGVDVADLLEAQAAQDGDIFYASNDDMPDYINDADSFMSV